LPLPYPPPFPTRRSPDLTTRRCPSSCSRRSTPSRTAWLASAPAPTTPFPSRSPSTGSSRASRRCCGGPPSSRPTAPTPTAPSPSTPPRARPAATAARSTSRPRSSTSSPTSSPGRTRSSAATRSTATCGGSGSTGGPTSSTSTSATCGGSWRRRGAPPASRPSAASATATGRRRRRPMPAEPRPPFRRRLLVALRLALGLALAALGMAAWLGAYASLTFRARAVVEAEAHEVASHVVLPDGHIDVDAYPWGQPHHRFLDPHIDPYFLRIFDGEGRLLRASENVALLGAPLPAPQVTDGGGLLRPLDTFRVGPRRLYAVTHPLVGPDGAPLGTVQVARYDPHLGPQLFRIGLGLGTGFLLVWAALLGLVWAVGGRVVRPLEAITTRARALSPEHLE